MCFNVNKSIIYQNNDNSKFCLAVCQSETFLSCATLPLHRHIRFWDQEDLGGKVGGWGHLTVIGENLL